MINSINLMNWNARSLKANLTEFNKFLKDHKIDISAVTETHLNSSIKIFVPNYFVIRKDRVNKKGGGVAFILKKDIKHEILPDLNLKIIESLGIEIFTDIGIIRFYVVYMSQNCTKKNNYSSDFKSDILKLTNFKGKFFILGDLNAKHNLWLNQKNNQNGQILAGLLNNGKFTIQYPDVPTYLCKATGSSSTLDICLTNVTTFFYPTRNHYFVAV